MSTLTIAFTNAVANRSRFALTMVAVSLSVAFLTATLVLADSLTGTAADDIAAAHEDLDFVAHGPIIVSGEGGPGEVLEVVRSELDFSLVAALNASPRIDQAAGTVTGFAKLVDNGVAIGDGTQLDVGREWIAVDNLNPFALTSGAAPVAANEVVIDSAAAATGDLDVGDTIEVLTATGVHELELVGLAQFGGADAAPLQRTVLFAPEAGRTILAATGFTDVRLSGAVDETANSIGQTLAAVDPTATLITGEQFVADEQAAIASPFGFLPMFLLVFAGIATVVGITIIFNTFVIAIGQRRRELALMRAVGADSRQVLAAVLAEAVIIGVAATAAGIALGLGGVGIIRRLMTLLDVPFIDGPTVVTATSIAIAAMVGIAVTAVSAWAPARRAAQAAPVEALRESSAEAPGLSPWRTGLGLAGIVVGAAGFVGAAASQSAPLLALGALLVVGIVLAGPALVTVVSRASRPALERALGFEGAIAATNLDRNPRRAASTSLALTIGVGLVGFFAIIATSLSTSLGSTIERQLSANRVVASASAEISTIDPTLIDTIETTPGVEKVGSIAIADGAISGAEAVVAGIDADVVSLYDFAVSAGSLADLSSGGIAVWSNAESPQVAVGDRVTVELAGGTIDERVVAIFDESLSGFDPPSHLVSARTLAAAEPGALDSAIFIQLDESAASAASSDLLRSMVADSPGALLQTKAEYISSGNTEIDAFRNLIFAMLGLTVLIAIVGIANTTALAVSERQREVGLLKAIGTTDRSVRRMIRWEAGLMSLTGAVVGISLALASSWSLIEAVGGTEINRVSVPWGQVAGLFLAATAAGVAAAAIPAWRVSSRPVLSALDA